MFRKGFIGMAAAAIGLALSHGVAAASQAIDAATAPSAPVKANKQVQRRSTANPRGSRSHKHGPGWGHLKVQRMARKRRNVLQNRRNQR